MDCLRTYCVFNRRDCNRHIGEFLKKIHLTEGHKTRSRKILNALAQNGSPMPLFETDPDRLSFSTTLLIHPNFLHHNEGENEGDNREVEAGLTERESAVLSLMRISDARNSRIFNKSVFP